MCSQTLPDMACKRRFLALEGRKVWARRMCETDKAGKVLACDTCNSCYFPWHGILHL